MGSQSTTAHSFDWPADSACFVHGPNGSQPTLFSSRGRDCAEASTEYEGVTMPLVTSSVFSTVSYLSLVYSCSSNAMKQAALELAAEPFGGGCNAQHSYPCRLPYESGAANLPSTASPVVFMKGVLALFASKLVAQEWQTLLSNSAEFRDIWSGCCQ